MRSTSTGISLVVSPHPPFISICIHAFSVTLVAIEGVCHVASTAPSSFHSQTSSVPTLRNNTTDLYYRQHDLPYDRPQIRGHGFSGPPDSTSIIVTFPRRML